RHPKTFAGLRDDDVEDWLDGYERVSLYNKWDNQGKLRNAIFYLADVAKIWFTNHEDEIATWPDFKTHLVEIFGKPSDRKASAERKLAARLQSLNETSTSYIEDVLALCRRVDKDMTEADRVRHVMKGISEEAFNVLLVHNPTTVKDITTHCQRLYEARNSRLQVFGLHGSSSGTMPSLSTDGLRNMIQKIVREEISNLLRPSSLPTTIGNDTGIRRMIQQELATTMAPSNSNTSITDPPTLPANPLQSDIFPSIIGAPTLAPLCTTFARDNFPHWRTAAPHEHVAPWNYRSRPVCYYCGIVGHVARLCRKTRQDFEARDYYYARERWNPRLDDRRDSRDRERNPSPEDLHRRPPSLRRRSPSPYPRSTSPM
ncbi:unnamed protein product, partial [Ixodes hexagonus]